MISSLPNAICCFRSCRSPAASIAPCAAALPMPGSRTRGLCRRDETWRRSGRYRLVSRRELYVFHVMNAWEEGERIVADVMQSEQAPLSPASRWFADRSKQVAGAAMPLDLRSRRQYRPLHAGLSRRDKRRISPPRRSPRRPGQPPRLVRLRQPALPMPLDLSARGACRRQRRAPWPILASGRRHHLRAGICRPAARIPSRATAGCWRSSGRAENRSDLAVLNASASMRVQSRWYRSATAFRTVFTATGCTRPDDRRSRDVPPIGR